MLGDAWANHPVCAGGGGFLLTGAAGATGTTCGGGGGGLRGIIVGICEVLSIDMGGISAEPVTVTMRAIRSSIPEGV